MNEQIKPSVDITHFDPETVVATDPPTGVPLIGDVVTESPLRKVVEPEINPDKDPSRFLFQRDKVGTPGGAPDAGAMFAALPPNNPREMVAPGFALPIACCLCLFSIFFCFATAAACCSCILFFAAAACFASNDLFFANATSSARRSSFDFMFALSVVRTSSTKPFKLTSLNTKLSLGLDFDSFVGGSFGGTGVFGTLRSGGFGRLNADGFGKLISGGFGKLIFDGVGSVRSVSLAISSFCGGTCGGFAFGGSGFFRISGTLIKG